MQLNCEWPARQGHAATYFRGCLFIFGGFDEAGYSNSMYGVNVSNQAGILFNLRITLVKLILLF